MARNENPPFARGSTFYDGGTIDANDLGGVNLEGMEWVFEDVNPHTGRARTERPVRCRVVRNVAAIALLPKYLVRLQNVAGVVSSRIDGYATPPQAAWPDQGFPLDEYLPAAGVPINDLCWIVIEGPAVCLSPRANMTVDIAIGEWLVSATGATSGATTSGRVSSQVLTGATNYLAANIQSRVGRALTAALTNTVNTDVLIDVGHW
jgi:hypothetical protein